MSDVKVIQFLKANYGEVHSIKPDLWGALVDGKRTLLRLEPSGMLSMRFELDTHRSEWVETPGWVDYLLLTRIRGYVKVFERGEFL